MKRRIKVLFGFTLIELLVVISIITVLAGLTLSMVDYARNKAARDRAKTEISALELALESYKIDNGDYPRGSDSFTDTIKTTTLTAASVLIPKGSTNPPAASGSASLLLYEALSADTDHDRTLTKEKTSGSAGRVYFAFKPGMLCPKGGTGTVTGIADPFGNVYGYSTSGTDSGYNPTFDLWSTADPGKTGTTGTATWITNW